ncbi:hypothetical protein ABIB82_006313 [Bradyrhizobium sp. i1.8.4]
MLQQAAVASAWDVPALLLAVAGSALRGQLRAAPAVPVLAQASPPAARVVQAQLPAVAEPGVLQAVQAVWVPQAAPDAARLPVAASALQVQLRAVRAARALQAGSASRALRPAAEPDAQAARQREAVPADAARRPAAPDVQERPAPVALAVPSAFRQVRFLPFAALVRRPAAKFVHAMLRWRTASPSAQSWQAARDEALSCLGVPGGKSGQDRKVRTEQFGRTMNRQPLGRIVAGHESSAKFISTL